MMNDDLFRITEMLGFKKCGNNHSTHFSKCQGFLKVLDYYCVRRYPFLNPLLNCKDFILQSKKVL